jgi:hypothetical protein
MNNGIILTESCMRSRPTPGSGAGRQSKGTLKLAEPRPVACNPCWAAFSPVVNIERCFFQMALTWQLQGCCPSKESIVLVGNLIRHLLDNARHEYSAWLQCG